jgi:hypothetical protein
LPGRTHYRGESITIPAVAIQAPSRGGSGNPSGGSTSKAFVPLEQIASIAMTRSPNEFWRENQQPVITVEAELEGADLGAVNRRMIESLIKAGAMDSLEGTRSQKFAATEGAIESGQRVWRDRACAGEGEPIIISTPRAPGPRAKPRRNARSRRTDR